MSFFNPNMSHEDFVKFVHKTRAKQAEQANKIKQVKEQWKSLFQADLPIVLDAPFRVCCKAVLEFPLLPNDVWMCRYRKFKKREHVIMTSVAL